MSFKKQWEFFDKIVDWDKAEEIVNGLEEPLPPLNEKLLDSLTSMPDVGVYGVKIFNDDQTPMGFVVAVFRSYFTMEEKEAIKFMLKIHEEGSVIRLRTGKEAASKLAEKITKEASKRGFPLKSVAVSLGQNK